MTEKMKSDMPPQEHKSEAVHETESGMDVFNPEIFEKLKQTLGITLPFQIEKEIYEAKGNKGDYNYKPAFVGYKISLPVPEGYYWHVGKERDPDIGTTWDYVSKDPVDPETGLEGTPVVKGGVGEWGAWCKEYGYDTVSREFDILDTAVEKMLGNDQFNRGSHQPADFEDAVAFAKDITQNRE